MTNQPEEEKSFDRKKLGPFAGCLAVIIVIVGLISLLGAISRFNNSGTQPESDTRHAQLHSYAVAVHPLIEKFQQMTSKFSMISGENYTSDKDMYDVVVQIIPEVSAITSRVNAISTPNSDLVELNALLSGACHKELNALTSIKIALENQSPDYVLKANDYFDQVTTYLTKYKSKTAVVYADY